MAFTWARPSLIGLLLNRVTRNGVTRKQVTVLSDSVSCWKLSKQFHQERMQTPQDLN